MTSSVLAGSAAPGQESCGPKHPSPTPEASHQAAEVLVSNTKTTVEFEQLFLQHLNAAYNLARLLMRNTNDAEDVVQESYLKAWRAFADFRGDATRSWLLTIVRNTSFTWLRDNRPRAEHFEYREGFHESREPTPEAESLGHERSRAISRCVQQLPPDFREVIILREMEELSYREIAEITGVPCGTVMSRLARARVRLAECLNSCAGKSLLRQTERP